MNSEQIVRLLHVMNFYLILAAIFSPLIIGWAWMEWETWKELHYPSFLLFIVYMFLYALVGGFRAAWWVAYGQ